MNPDTTVIANTIGVFPTAVDTVVHIYRFYDALRFGVSPWVAGSIGFMAGVAFALIAAFLLGSRIKRPLP